jgi:hypothetical protein
MKTVKLYYAASIVFFTSIIFSSCQNYKIALETPSQELLDSISLIAMNEVGDAQSDISHPAAKGLQWKAWEAWFKNCPENETFRKDIVYLGIASSKGLGYIMSKDKSLDRRDFYKVSKDTSLHKTFFNRGVSVKQCDLSKMSNFSFDMMVDGNVLKTVNAKLGALVENAKKITVKSGSWRIESIETGPFMDFINDSKDPLIIRYRVDLLNKANIILTKVLKVSGFEAEIESRDSIDAGLEATLENGFDVKVIPIDSTNRIGFNLNFKKGANRTINVSSSGEISLFGQASKGKMIQ